MHPSPLLKAKRKVVTVILDDNIQKSVFHWFKTMKHQSVFIVLWLCVVQPHMTSHRSTDVTVNRHRV